MSLLPSPQLKRPGPAGPALSPHPRRVLAVRMLVARVAWLDARRVWDREAGLVVWAETHANGDAAGGPFAPAPADLARAEYCLNRIARHPRSARAALGGDPNVWLRERRARLETAKRLHALRAPNFSDLTRRAQAGDIQSIVHLVSLLDAEALCVAGWDAASPARALLAFPTPLVRAALGRFAARPPDGADAAAVTLSSVLVALLQGAQERRQVGEVKSGGPVMSPPLVRAARAWGRKYGLSNPPGLFAALLADGGAKDGPPLADRCRRVVDSANPFALPAPLLRALLDDGTPAQTVVALAEAAADRTGPLASDLQSLRAALPVEPETVRRVLAEQLRPERARLVDELARLLHGYVEAARDPAVVETFVLFVAGQRDLFLSGPPFVDLATPAVLAPLRAGRSLPASLQRAYLELLARHAVPVLWNRAALPADARLDAPGAQAPRPKQECWVLARRKRAERLQLWLCRRENEHVHPVAALLAATGDPVLTGKAVAQEIHAVLAPSNDEEDERPSPAVCRALLTLARRLDLRGDATPLWSAHRLLTLLDDERDGNGGGTEQASARLLLALRPARTPEQRAHYLEYLIESLAYWRTPASAAAVNLTHLTRVLPRLIAWDEQRAAAVTADGAAAPACWCAPLLAGALVLRRHVSTTEADAWLDAALALLAEREKRVGNAVPAAPEHEPETVLRQSLFLATVLAGGERDRFFAALRACLDHARLLGNGDDGEEWPEKIAGHLARLPGLRAPLAALLPTQPQRCLTLLGRLARAVHLGPDVLAPLEDLAENTGDTALLDEPDGSDDGDGWADLLVAAPDLAPTVAACWHAGWLLGRPQNAPPPGVRAALTLPRKLAAELAHLEERLAVTAPPPPGLAARAANLRARLADETALRATIAAEARERLAQFCAEIRLAAAEQQVGLCYRARLETLAGPLPPGLVLDDDLANAVLIGATIRQNRRLLSRLLRAHLNGDAANDLAAHPANAAFLRALTDRGADARAWRSRFPRRYPCPHVPGGAAHLWAETDPLPILQMGNYFHTCLSATGFNAFSTVANAADANKRVVYARDGQGRIIGRKLIGITEAGALVGFHTYTNLPDEAGNGALHALFRRYVAAFAARCRLPLADNGTVPTLLAEAWYDDGVVPWSASTAERAEQPSPRAETLPHEPRK